MKLLFKLTPPQRSIAIFLMNVGFLLCLMCTILILLYWVVIDSPTLPERMAIFVMMVILLLYPFYLPVTEERLSGQASKDGSDHTADDGTENHGNA